ncbi:hypothetical protein [Reyranella sp.]|uniref:hypothetical protein n=1 Tax=Reyranella sp. TaxID=1929291 RepID=UPI003BAC068A
MIRGNLAAVGRLMLVCGLAFGLGACATVVAGTTQEVHVQSEPPGAACRLDKQSGNVSIGFVRKTPEKVKLPRSKDNVVIKCTLDGYQESDELMVSSFSGATVGNILLGGLVGIAIDAASGANNKYPERVTVVLTPASFPSDEARDAHFAGIRSRIEQGAAAEIKLVNERCGGTGRELCNIEIKQIGDARDKALADLDRRRLAARIVPAS